MPLVVIVGASRDRSKFGNKALRAYVRQGWEVLPVNPREPEIEGLPTATALSDVEGPVDRVALYVPPAIGEVLLPDIAALAPSQLWVNPGAESPELLVRARGLGLEPILGCAIIDVGESPATL